MNRSLGERSEEKTMDNNMLKQIKLIPELHRREFDRLDAAVRRALDHNDILSVKSILITGCGDSYMAGAAAQMAFTSLTGLRVDAEKAMQAARYSLVDQPHDFPLNPLTIAISVSGEVSRTVEAARVAREKGALVLAVTGDPDSRLGQTADRLIDCSLPPVPDAPGVLTYHFSLLALYLLAIRFAEVRGKISQNQGNVLRDELKNLADIIEGNIMALSEPAQALAGELQSHCNYVFVGHGPNFATALFSAAKVVEASGYQAVGQDTEEWAHLEYFINVNVDTPTFLISPGGRGHNRVAELMEAMNRVGRTIVAVVPKGDAAILPSAAYVLPLSGDVPEMYSPLVYALPGALFSAYLYEEIGAEPFRRSEAPYEAGDNAIRSSDILSVSDLEHALITNDPS
jgi:glucosamine--fructose-6-phosphate aminotransferase (isomerizing)